MLVLVIAGTAWLSTARLVRAEALTLRMREYVQAARVMGGGGLRVVLRHIAPNALGTIVVNVTFQVANAILLLATLSYLGLGVQFPSVDWGDMIAHGDADASPTATGGRSCRRALAIIVVVVGVHDARRRPAGLVLRRWLTLTVRWHAGTAAGRCSQISGLHTEIRRKTTRPCTPSTASA